MLTLKTTKKAYAIAPENRLARAGLAAGEKAGLTVRKRSLVATKEMEDFLSLEGALKDADIEQPIKELDKKWKAWKPRNSL